MLTVRFPTGFSIQYNDANFAIQTSLGHDLYADKEKTRWVASAHRGFPNAPGLNCPLVQWQGLNLCSAVSPADSDSIPSCADAMDQLAAVEHYLGALATLAHNGTRDQIERHLAWLVDLVKKQHNTVSSWHAALVEDEAERCRAQSKPLYRSLAEAARSGEPLYPNSPT